MWSDSDYVETKLTVGWGALSATQRCREGKGALKEAGAALEQHAKSRARPS